MHVMLPHYLQKFQKLRTAKYNGSSAPHKPVLLFSVIQLIEEGFIRSNRIYITPELVARFIDNWNWLVKNDGFSAKFYLPFYHLTGDGFWHIKLKPGRELALTSSFSPKSLTSLKEVVDYACFDDELYLILTDTPERNMFKEVLFSTYFSTAISSKPVDLFSTLEQQMLTESVVQYRKEIEAANDIELFVRGGAFKRLVPRIYDYTCCISGMRITATRDVQMVDACHIIPFSESHDDTIGNGISLCPNLHLVQREPPRKSAGCGEGIW